MAYDIARKALNESLDIISKNKDSSDNWAIQWNLHVALSELVKSQEADNAMIAQKLDSLITLLQSRQ